MGFAQVKLVLVYFLVLYPKMRPENSRPFFFSSQLEERAIEELLQYYGGLDNACEFVTVFEYTNNCSQACMEKGDVTISHQGLILREWNGTELISIKLKLYDTIERLLSYLWGV